jgi:hypothetical protein
MLSNSRPEGRKNSPDMLFHGIAVGKDANKRPGQRRGGAMRADGGRGDRALAAFLAAKREGKRSAWNGTGCQEATGRRRDGAKGSEDSAGGWGWAGERMEDKSTIGGFPCGDAGRARRTAWDGTACQQAALAAAWRGEGSEDLAGGGERAGFTVRPSGPGSPGAALDRWRRGTGRARRPPVCLPGVSIIVSRRKLAELDTKEALRNSLLHKAL